jgi:hypothetical protein
MDSHDYMVTRKPITIDSRFYWRARTKNGGYYWKTFDIFTQGSTDIDQAWREGNVTCPFWSHPIPKFVSNQGGTKPEDLSYVAILELGKYSFDPKGSVGHYTGKDGPQQGYELLGAWRQRRVDAFVQIVRDPRLQRYADDAAIKKMTGTAAADAITDHRLNNASSCIGCHIDGMNRSNNYLRNVLVPGRPSDLTRPPKDNSRREGSC